MADTPDDVRRKYVELALDGQLPMRDLTESEREVVNAELNARIHAAVVSTDIGKLLRSKGMTTVFLDADGSMVAQHPDGSTDVLGDI